MHRRHGILAACGAMLVASACTSAPSPSAVQPNLQGARFGSERAWMWVASTLTQTGLWQTWSCPGSLAIDRQDGTVFSGSYSIDCDKHQSSGTVEGRIDPGGPLSFQLSAGDGRSVGLPPDFTGTNCQITSDSVTYEGTISGTTVSVQRVETMGCADARWLVTASFQGNRQ